MKNKVKGEIREGVIGLPFSWATVIGKNIFTSRDIAKKAHLMHVLNIISTILSDFFNRNDRTNDFLNDFALSFPNKDEVVPKLEETADIILKLKLKPKSYWYNKSNIFSLIIAIANILDEIGTIDLEVLKSKLESFEQNIPDDYRLASTEAVNNKKERELRNYYIVEILNNSKKV